MSRAATLVWLGAALPALLAGCLFEDCPYTLTSIEASGASPVRYDADNATRAADALTAMGFEVHRDRLIVNAGKDGLWMTLNDDARGVSAWVKDDVGKHEFNDYDDALAYVDAHRAESAAAINATLGELSARLGWPPFEVGRAEGPISVC